MTATTYTVRTIDANGQSRTEQVPMTPEMAASFERARAAWAEHGCRCAEPHPDHVHLSHRGHSVDVTCTDCGGWRQIG